MGEGVRVIVITGPVGAGKSTIGGAMSGILSGQERIYAVDQDYLRSVYPNPDGDPFGAQLGLRNLAACWQNVAPLGVRTVVISDVVEDMAQRAEYERAIPGSDVTIVRLDVPLEVIFERLEERESEATIEWYRERAPQLQAIMERGRVGNIVIDVGHRTPDDIAREIIARCGLTP